MTQTLGKIIAWFNETLNLKTAVWATSATLDGSTDIDGVTYPTGVYFLTVDRNESTKQFIKCTLTGTALSNIQSVSAQGVLTTGMSLAHRKWASVEMTDFAIIRKMLDLLDGSTSFDSATPLGYDGTATISTPNQFATKAYIDGIAIAGSPDATTSTKGIGRVSVAPVAPATPIFVGDNDNRVPTQAENDALVGTSGTPSTSNKYVTNDDTSGTGLIIRTSKLGNIYGEGSDGAVTISIDTTLTTDKYYTNLTVNSGILLNTAGYRVFVNSTLTNNGTIQNNGANGTNGGNAVNNTSAGTGGAGGAATAAVTVPATGGAGAGANGIGINGTGTAGTASTAVTNSVGVIGGAGGAGGAGIGPGTNPGGTGGVAGAVTVSSSGLKDLFTIFQLGNIAGAFKVGTSGGGGGSGGSNANSGNGHSGGGGGGGSAGGTVFVAARTLAGTGTLKSTGGNGGNGGNSTASSLTNPGGCGGSSGGGGGAGGVLILISLTAANPYTMTVTAGTGGTGGTGAIVGGGTLANGVSGSSGTIGVSVFISTNA